ncbi:hypothetical protein BDV18DRAFT_129665 [Aspergillus unguis]
MSPVTVSQSMETLDEVEAKYKAEREKRLRTEGMEQFADLYTVDKLSRFLADPWAGSEPLRDQPPPLSDNGRCEILIIGAGYGGLLFAARLIDAGFDPNDIRMIDNAGGFGGTWYWNRYPGLMCDIESYIYMPLLEETGYMPTQKYVSGTELREHAERIAAKWNLTDKALFHSTVETVEWDNDREEWTVRMTRSEPGQDNGPMTVRSRFVMLTTGFSVIPQIPRIQGLESFQGDTFHTARWDYGCTGGSPTDPVLSKLADKQVGIIGTGATAIQVVPAVAPWAQHLYVFQRTPSAVDRRDNRTTDAEWWDREIRGRPGWQMDRRRNFNAFLSNSIPKPLTDMVSDGWTSMVSYSALVGTPKPPSGEKLDEYNRTLRTLDFPRQQGIRDRVDQLVTQKDVAEKLKAWYPGWCKRPCFHDEYLQAFNRDNVTLVDTNGRGVEHITEKGIVIQGKEYPLDVLILSTGYRSAFLYSPGRRVDIDIRGRNNLSLDDKWTSGVATLHGVMSHDFPNLFWPGFAQSGGTPNFAHCIDLSAQHVAEIMAEARARVKPASSELKGKYNVLIEATAAAEEAWSDRIASQAGVFGATAGCTPSYINAEGELDRTVSPEVLKKRARGAMWGKGILDYERVLKEWEADGKFEGVGFHPVA